MRLRGNQIVLQVADGHDAADADFVSFGADDGLQDIVVEAPESTLRRPDASGVVGTTMLGFVDVSLSFSCFNTTRVAGLLRQRDGQKATVRLRIKGTATGRPQMQFNATWACEFHVDRQGGMWNVTLTGRGKPTYSDQA